MARTAEFMASRFMPRPVRLTIRRCLLQLSWEPEVPNVTINLYQEGTAPDGSRSPDHGGHHQDHAVGMIGRRVSVPMAFRT